tara:strand:+ start:1162 stop:1341 length:180 start_codon:yes stop_codon:yes gene_type:complete
VNGNWTKWVLERMDDEQKGIYERVREWLETMGWEYLSVNFVLRYCDGQLWDYQASIDYI